MNEHKITVDVYAHWGNQSPRYRVYVDNNLLTERDFIWPGSTTFVRENILVNLTPGKHTLKIEQIGNNGTIQAKNVVVDDVASSLDFVIPE